MLQIIELFKPYNVPGFKNVIGVSNLGNIHLLR